MGVWFVNLGGQKGSLGVDVCWMCGGVVCYCKRVFIMYDVYFLYVFCHRGPLRLGFRVLVWRIESPYSLGRHR